MWFADSLPVICTFANLLANNVNLLTFMFAKNLYIC